MTIFVAPSGAAVDSTGSAPHPSLLRYAAPALLAIALALPWWQINMTAPQYPYGLHVTTWFFTVTGDVSEVDELNHYIGFMPLASVAAPERHLAFIVGPLAVLLLALATTVRNTRWSSLLAVPAVSLPVFFVLDLAAWLYYAGHHLDVHAALSSSVAPWTPRLLGNGGIGQFHTYSSFGAGFYLAVAAAAVTVLALRARKPSTR
ncbi:MAG: cytochrome C [Vulcanimicrobiaceae bacterium]